MTDVGFKFAALLNSNTNYIVEADNILYHKTNKFHSIKNILMYDWDKTDVIFFFLQITLSEAIHYMSALNAKTH